MVSPAQQLCVCVCGVRCMRARASGVQDYLSVLELFFPVLECLLRRRFHSVQFLSLSHFVLKRSAPFWRGEWAVWPSVCVCVCVLKGGKGTETIKDGFPLCDT